METTIATKSTITYLIELNYKTLLFDIVTTIGYAIWSATNKSLQAVLVKIYSSGDGPQFTAHRMAS